jgi:hypothetical protein
MTSVIATFNPDQALPQNLWVRNDDHANWNGLFDKEIARDSSLKWAGIFRIVTIWPIENG